MDALAVGQGEAGKFGRIGQSGLAAVHHSANPIGAHASHPTPRCKSSTSSS
jgi:hypothetical protein